MPYQAPVSVSFVVVAVAAATLSGCGDGDSFQRPPACAVPVADSPVAGPADALVTIVEFADLECFYCGKAQPTLSALDKEYEGELRWVFKHLPLGMHPHSFDAAIAAECAGAQDRFWEMTRAVFENQASLSNAVFVELAESLQLDMNAWEECFDTRAPEARIVDDVNLAIEYGVSATPTFFVNGLPILGAAPISTFRRAVDVALADGRDSGMDGEAYYASLVQAGCQ